jgi:phosphate transport system substrate-binding protein
VQWPAGIGAKGNEGVANNVANTKGAIGYVEYAYAKQNKLTYTKMLNKAGLAVSPTSESFQAAAASADWKSKPGYGVILANQAGDKSWPMTAATWILMHKQAQDGAVSGEASWPITAATFILMHKEPTDKAASAEAIKFFKWAFEKGGKMAGELDYVAMPANVVRDVQATWASEIKDGSGKSLFGVTN